MNAFLLLAALALPVRAGDCRFDGACGPRPALTFAGDSPVVEPAVETEPWDGLRITAPEPERERPNAARVVPTPLGWTPAEDGSLKAGFYKGLDSGFKTVFAGVTYVAVAGIEASGAPQRANAGTFVFTALGVLLSIPASVIGVVVGAPLGALAGMIAEKASPGSTSRWFTF